jgi:uncharacterized membrane protein
MKMDITRLAWMIIGIMLIISGGKHVLTQQIVNRMQSGGPPLLHGWSVVVFGMVEIAIGVWLTVRYLRQRKQH